MSAELLDLFANRWNAMFDTRSFLEYQCHWKSHSTKWPVLNRTLKHNQQAVDIRIVSIDFREGFRESVHNFLRCQKKII